MRVFMDWVTFFLFSVSVDFICWFQWLELDV
jgi:hypothetical protein